jgi:hypothetical protein
MLLEKHQGNGLCEIPGHRWVIILICERSVCLINHHSMLMYQEVEVWIHVFSTSVSGQLCTQETTPGEKNPGIQCKGDWVCPKAGLNGVKKRKISHPYRETNPDSSTVHSVARCYTDCAISAPSLTMILNKQNFYDIDWIQLAQNVVCWRTFVKSCLFGVVEGEVTSVPASVVGESDRLERHASDNIDRLRLRCCDHTNWDRKFSITVRLDLVRHPAWSPVIPSTESPRNWLGKVYITILLHSPLLIIF